MTPPRRTKEVVAVAVCLGLGLHLWRTEHVAAGEKQRLAARFSFAKSALPEVPGPEKRYFRTLHPSVARVAMLLSFAGAAVALNDLDGDGLSNDLCYVETRTDQVIVAPAPGTPARYQPYALDVSGWFDRSRMAPLGCVPADLNEDGRMDLIVPYAGRAPMLFLNTGAGFVARPLVAEDVRWSTITVTPADIDGDGHVDLVVGNYFADGADLYNGAGAGAVRMPHSFSRARNGGGEHFFRWVSARGGNDPDVHFIEVANPLPPEVRGGWTLAIAARDLDGDQLPELYFAHDFGSDLLLHNRSRPGQFAFDVARGAPNALTPASKVLGRDSFKSMGVDFGDVNGDGLADIYVSNVTVDFGAHESQFLFLNTGHVDQLRQGIAPFADRSDELGLAHSGWAWDSKLDDFDNDGVPEAVQAVGFFQGTTNRWPELHELSTVNDAMVPFCEQTWPNLLPGDDVAGHGRNPFFVRMGDKYVDVAEQVGFGEQQVSRGIATADVDGDGDLDMAVANMWGPSSFYRNDCPNCGGFLGLHVRLPAGAQVTAKTEVRPGHPDRATPTIPAVGAEITLVRSDGRRLIGAVDGGNGHTGKRSPDVLFGLGEARGSAAVDIAYRDRAGIARHASFHLGPGWHTVVLASQPPVS